MTIPCTRRTLCLLAVLTVAAGPQAWAQGVLCDFEDEDLIVFEEDFTVEIDPRVPVIGQPIMITVTACEPTTKSGTLYYRVTGTSSYTSITAMPMGGAVFSAEIPAEVMTVRGLDLYGEFVDEGELSTFPEENPEENPFRLRIFLGTVRAEVALAPRQYRMISVPVDIGPSSIAAVLADDFGAQENSRWRAARWQPEFEVYDGSVGQTVTGGDAFWAITATGGAFDVDAATSTEPDSMNTITLAPGQNQIGNPFAFPVAWDDVIADGAVSLPMRFDGVSPYVEVTRLEPWEGYFVSNDTGRPVTLTVPALEAGGGRRLAVTAASYTVRLSGWSEAYGDTLNVVGFAADAAPGRDRLDLREPPMIGEHLRVSVLGDGSRWIRNLRPEPNDGDFWDVEITVSDELLEAPRRVTMSLTEEGARPNGFGLWVIDRDLGTALAVEDGTFEVTLRPETPVRRLRMIVGTEAFARAGSEGAPLEPVAFALDAGFPNPFAGYTTMDYRLATRGRATLEVFDLLGRRIRVLADADHTAGAHTAVWDGRDGSGRPVASGVYLARLRAAGASATRRVTVLR